MELIAARMRETPRRRGFWPRRRKERRRARRADVASRALSSPHGVAMARLFDFVRDEMRADRIEIVVMVDGGIVVHDGSSVRRFATDEAAMFVRVWPDLSTATAVIGDGAEARGVLAVSRREPLTSDERATIEALARRLRVP